MRQRRYLYSAWGNAPGSGGEKSVALKAQIIDIRGKRLWQQGYGVFSISPSHLDKLVAYLDDQEEHHRKVSVDYDEQYVWG